MGDHLAEAQGLTTLKVKHTERTCSPQFKLNMVRYYLTSNIGMSKTEAKFNLDSSQVYDWTYLFKNQGIAGLLNKQRGKPNKMTKKKYNRPAKKLTLSKEQRYEEKITQQAAKIESLKIDNLMLKKVVARYPCYQTSEKHR